MASMRWLILGLALSACTAQAPEPPLLEAQPIDWQPELAVEYDADGTPRLVEKKKH